VDANGNRTITRINTVAGAGAIQTAILACMTGDFDQWWESAVTANGAPAPAGGQYQGVQQRAALSFICGDATIAVLIVPCPAVSIFLADQQTVDPANLQVIALVAACIGSLTSSTGSAAVAFIGGVLGSNLRNPL